MKEITNCITFLSALALVFSCNASFSQTTMDTVKPGKANDPMIVNPGKVNDGMAVKPAPSNDGMSLMTDTGFLNKNIADNQMEIELAVLGREKGTMAEVRKIAALMVADHTAMLNELERLAAKKLQPRQRKSEMKMPSADLPQGKDFDLAWAAQMLTMHQAKIAELESFIGLTRDAELKAAVMNALPKIKMHRELLLKIPGVKEKSQSSKTI